MDQYRELIRLDQHLRKAIRRGDAATAERWLKIAERAAAVALKFSALKSEHMRRGFVPNPR